MNNIFKNDLFKGKTVLVTGGGTGIGFAIAQLLGSLGANIIIAARTVDVLKEAQTTLKAQQIDCDIHELNIRDDKHVCAFFEELAKKKQLPDVLINNAGGQFEAAAVDISANGFRSVIDLNLNGTWHMSSNYGKACLAAQKPGCIVNIVLCCGSGMPNMVHAGAARAGVINMTKTLANEWAPLIRVNAVAPGTIQTSGLDQYDQDALQQAIQKLPVKRMGQPEEVAQAVAYLCSDAAQYITGTTLEIDGGEHLIGASL
jgi:NAD(P)-dependent dehydrogenase (short-subunit alcohol dehydrogenase family)